MKIGLVIYGSLDQLSGGYLYDRSLVEHLRRSGDHVEVISLRWRSYPGLVMDNWRREVSRRLDGLDVDLLIQDELNHPSLARHNAALSGRYPIVSLVHHLRSSELHPRLVRSLYRRVEQHYLDSVDAFIFNSETTQASVAHRRTRPVQQSIIAYPAGDRLNPQVTQALIRDRAHEPGPLRIIFVANVIPRKNLHELLGALARLPEAAWRLTVVGALDTAPRYAARMQRLVRRMGWQKQVQFTGPLRDQALVNVIQRQHVFALPSYEGFGIAHLEAMGFGLPAIGSSAGASWEVIRHAETGFLVEPGRGEQLSGYLKQLLNDRSRLAKMGLAAQDEFRTRPTWEQSMSRIRSFLPHLI